MMDTEKRNPKTKHIDRAGTMEIVKLINLAKKRLKVNYGLHND